MLSHSIVDDARRCAAVAKNIPLPPEQQRAVDRALPSHNELDQVLNQRGIQREVVTVRRGKQRNDVARGVRRSLAEMQRRRAGLAVCG